MKIVHVIIGLHVGGAELMLLKLLQASDRTRFDPTVIALMDGGEVAERIGALGVPVHHLGLRSIGHTPGTLLRLRRLARALDPDVVQGWMYHGNVAASLLARWTPRAPGLVWNIRHTLADPRQEKAATRALIRLGGRWSGRVHTVVHNAQVSVAQHTAQGFRRENAVVIPNGFDTAVFRPDAGAGLALRRELDLPADAVLVGTLGRYHPVKGHGDFLRAVARLRPRSVPVHVLCAGRGLTAANADLRGLLTGCEGRVHLLGQRDDPQRFLAGLDVFCLPSRGEGFPNALGEAMACGVPCVATDVGEAAVMLEGLSQVVPIAAPAALAQALEHVLDLEPSARRALGARCRERIASRYGLAAVAARYAALYAAVGAAGHGMR
jgi:glycosyltransferase involved in cell wall biosynthesis